MTASESAGDGSVIPTSAAEGSSLDVRERLVEALRLDLVGPGSDHELAEERLPGWERPLKWYLTGFLIPSDTPFEHRSDAEADDPVDETPETAGLAEESAEDRAAAKRGFFPSSMGLRLPGARRDRHARCDGAMGDYAQDHYEGPDGKRGGCVATPAPAALSRRTDHRWRIRSPGPGVGRAEAACGRAARRRVATAGCAARDAVCVGVPGEQPPPSGRRPR